MSTAEFVRQLRERAVIVDRSKALYWRTLKLRRGPSSGLRIADELRRQVLAQRPDWPSKKERDEDHAAHLRVLDALERTPRRD